MLKRLQCVVIATGLGSRWDGEEEGAAGTFTHRQSPNTAPRLSAEKRSLPHGSLLESRERHSEMLQSALRTPSKTVQRPYKAPCESFEDRSEPFQSASSGLFTAPCSDLYKVPLTARSKVLGVLQRAVSVLHSSSQSLRAISPPSEPFNSPPRAPQSLPKAPPEPFTVAPVYEPSKAPLEPFTAPQSPSQLSRPLQIQLQSPSRNSEPFNFAPLIQTSQSFSKRLAVHDAGPVFSELGSRHPHVLVTAARRKK